MLDMLTAEARPVTSLMGRNLIKRNEIKRDLEIKLSEARTAFHHQMTIDSCIRYGRVLAEVARPHEAIDVFSLGLIRFPDSHALYRHRGHRLITVRAFDRAIADCERAVLLAAAVDYQDVRKQVPESLQFEIWYHLGLCWFLKGDFSTAAKVYQRCLDYCSLDESLVACVDWLFRSLRRLGRDAEARKLLERIDGELDSGESRAYHELLLYYKGELRESDVLQNTGDADFATRAYGIAVWRQASGDRSGSRDLLEAIVAKESWMAFGHIAAEADLYRSDLV